MIDGSNWNKWDLHIHTPDSIIQYYGENCDEIWENFIKDLEDLPKEFKVIGINDYLFLEGYKKVLEFKKNGRLPKIDLILPVVEFRIEKFAGVDFDKHKRINLHVIFSNELSPEIIQSQFLNGLEQYYKLEKDGNEWNQAITVESITNLGKRIKESIPKEELSKYGSDLEEGFNNLNINEEQIFKLLKRDVFKDKYLIAIGKTEWDSLKWSNSSISTKKTIINRADIVFTAAESPENYLKARDVLKEQEVNNLLLDCSDAHYFSSSKNKDRIGNSFCWIKADRTFEGLKQILYEQDDRIFVGDYPEIIERVNSNKTKFVKRISINKEANYNAQKGIWFNKIDIPLNFGMVSIIGNKGSGKSAIADIIGLCGNSHHYDDFSFLDKKRFLKDGLAKNFFAELEFASEEKIKKNLNDGTDKNAPERVRYLPQSFFERLTNNLESYDFERTLEELVFSYLPEQEKLGKDTFQDLIRFKNESTKKDIELIEKEIKNLNSELINLEKKAHPNFLEKLKNELEIREKELKELEKSKPEEVKNPDSDEKTKEQNEKITKELNKLNDEKERIEKSIDESNKKLIDLKQEIEELSVIKNDFLRFESELKNLISSKNTLLERYELDATKILSYKLDLSDLDWVLSNKKKNHVLTEKLLLSEEQILDKFSQDKQSEVLRNSLIIKLSTLVGKIKEQKSKLSAPYKKYQDYLEKLKKWQQLKDGIIGNIEISGTLKWYKKQIEYISETLPDEIKEKRKLRTEKTISILDKKLQIIAIYNKLKESIDDEIKGHKDILKDYEINIDVALKLSQNFISNFLSYINKGVKGSFYEIEQSNERIKNIIENRDFQKYDILTDFLEEIIANLEKDKREGYNGVSRQINEQVLDGKLHDFYNYLFSINYLEPTYELKLGEKHITQLSPGEKGAMLIVFYLMLDKERIPLIIDQPEENLDNESIYKILVHFIKSTKKRRQVIMVTHNPNLAIVGDSEQIIYVSIDKKNKNKFSFSSGAIENPTINELSSKILEGTIKAFDIRRLKYFNVE